MMEAPRFTELLKSERTEGDATLWYRGVDNRKYRVELATPAIGATIEALQDSVSKSQPGRLLTLTVTGCQPLANPNDVGLLVQTKQWGQIVLSIPREGLAAKVQTGEVMPPRS